METAVGDDASDTSGDRRNMRRLIHTLTIKSVLVILLALTLCTGAWYGAASGSLMNSYAASQEEKDAAQKEADEAKAAAEAKQKEAKEAGKKAAAATANLEEAEKRLNELSGAIEQTKADIAATEADIAETKVRMEAKEKEIEEQNNALNNRLTAMYKTGTAGFVDVILDSESVEELLANTGMVHKILENDQDMLKKLQNDYKELQEMKQHLESQEAYLEQRKVELEAAQVETEELKKKYKAEADKYKAMEDQLEAEGNQLAAEAAAKQAAAEAIIVEKGGTIEVAPGAYAWPTKSNWEITSNYGWRICPFHGREFHNGLDLVLSNGTYGSPVYAIADGVVTRASWYGGYGNCIQLALGGGYSALYGHLSGYNCSSGDFVKKGQVIGYIGSTGNSTGPHLHFTVFKDGNSTNPLGLY